MKALGAMMLVVSKMKSHMMLKWNKLLHWCQFQLIANRLSITTVQVGCKTLLISVNFHITDFFDILVIVNALTDYAWWNGRDGTPNYYWNGSKSSNSRGCACYETDSCKDIGHDHRTRFSKVQIVAHIVTVTYLWRLCNLVTEESANLKKR